MLTGDLPFKFLRCTVSPQGYGQKKVRNLTGLRTLTSNLTGLGRVYTLEPLMKNIYPLTTNLVDEHLVTFHIEGMKLFEGGELQVPTTDDESNGVNNQHYN